MDGHWKHSKRLISHHQSFRHNLMESKGVGYEESASRYHSGKVRVVERSGQQHVDNNNLPSNPSPHPTMIENESNKDLSDDEVEMSMISDDYPSSQDGNNTTAGAGAGAGAGGPPNQLLPSVNIQHPNFMFHYTIIEQIGSGASSKVWKCVERLTGKLLAAKVIDLRPLQLRAKFSIDRVHREVDIMRRLRHPNIVALHETYETEQQLVLIQEYVPGVELFDAILSNKHLSEGEARPIFIQVARAVNYLHGMHIIHRDIKPENVMVLNGVSTDDGLQPMVKLLDFGLSKSVGEHMGSAARTFVGTPCYLAPEVELRQHGGGGAYGMAVDCWSLGALLFVVLSARFPEFQVDSAGKKYVHMRGSTWNTVSDEAKDLIRRLMRYNPAERMSVSEALNHPWVIGYSDSTTPVVETIPSQSLPFGTEMDPHSVAVPPRSFQQHYEDMHTEVAVLNRNDPNKFTPLIELYQRTAGCLQSSLVIYENQPEAAAALRKSAIQCRENLASSLKLLKKISVTADQVLGLIPDLWLAIDEGEPALALGFFCTVKKWVGELYRTVAAVQEKNSASTREIAALMKECAFGFICGSEKNLKNNFDETREIMGVEGNKNDIESKNKKNGNGIGGGSSGHEKKKSLAGQCSSPILDLNPDHLTTVDRDTYAKLLRIRAAQQQQTAVQEIESERGGNIEVQKVEVEEPPQLDDDQIVEMFLPVGEEQAGVAAAMPRVSSLSLLEDIHAIDEQMSIEFDLPQMNAMIEGPLPPRADNKREIVKALHLLYEVEVVMERLAIFWANTEVIFEVLVQKGDLVENFVRVAHNQKLMHRFKERMDDYQRFWSSIRDIARAYSTSDGEEGPSGKMHVFMSNLD